MQGKYWVVLLTMGEVRVRFRRAKGTLIVLSLLLLLSSSSSEEKVKDRWCGEEIMSS